MAPSKGRQRFQADLDSATDKNIPNVSQIQKGDVEDEFTFVYTHPSQPDGSHYEIHVQPQDVHGYPGDNSFLVYTNHDVPQDVAQVLDASIAETAGMKVADVLTNLSRRLRFILENDTGNDVEMTNADDLEVLTDDDSSQSEFDYVSDDDDTFGDGPIISPNEALPEPMEISPSAMERFRRDLLSVLEAGFHTGKICGFEKGAITNIAWVSIRANKLRLSKEIHEAWNIASSEYVILLIQYSGHYISFEDALNLPARHCNMTFRLRKSSNKKPTLQQAIAAFDPWHQRDLDGQELFRFWISESIESFMETEFVPMLKIRRRHAVSWAQAKKILQSQVKEPAAGMPSSKDYQSTGNEEQINAAQLPSFLDDHMLSEGEISLPLIASQFALHYVVRCTDYCTICHSKTEGDFDALRPYVCNAPLCLYQYMDLGFGPNMESEIINQPKVVDLLVSLCFVSLSVHQGEVRMRDFPTGLNLQVPKIRSLVSLVEKPEEHPAYVQINGGVLVDPVAVVFNKADSTATIVGEYDLDLREGQWVVIAISVTRSPISRQDSRGRTVSPHGETVLHHARIHSKVGARIVLDISSQHTMPDNETSKTPLVGDQVEIILPRKTYSGHLVLYDEELDSLKSKIEKAFSMSIILAALPSVQDMRSYLLSDLRHSLAKWDRMTRAAVDLLRWIIASNRSYIVQVDTHPAEASLGRPYDRISGIKGWIQFRFAQGSPEKEVLFNDALKDIDKPHKTLVAWHGSALQNWHSIIRQGLDYTTAANGRAYGDGIYFSRYFDTSLAYSSISDLSVNSPSGTKMWPQSSLQVTAVMSLNELANLPESFNSNEPHYVVQTCHWTRCRYLFVKPNSPEMDGAQLTQTVSTLRKQGQIPEFIQDPYFVARGPQMSELFIPQRAIPSQEKRNVSAESADDVSEVESDSGDDEEDLKFLQPEGSIRTVLTYATDFRPGTLDYSKLPTLAPPSYATGIAQKALGLEIKKLHKLQAATPLHQLGWYIDFDRLNNMFQWIVEFHSFDPSLPLAKDMKVKGITSIVFEMRFLSSFPMSPPFVRVIQPRFLPFANGGGGHVTAGGAMCMELLTNTGWSPANSLESVLLQVRLAMCSENPPARLEKTKSRQSSPSQYGIHEAIDAYTRAAQVHGWQVPEDLKDLQGN
ncbi:hypothetical protein Hte_003527 [Hypoxylon texense]